MINYLMDEILKDIKVNKEDIKQVQPILEEEYAQRQHLVVEDDDYYEDTEPCEECDGEGYFYDEDEEEQVCDYCHGTGVIDL